MKYRSPVYAAALGAWLLLAGLGHGAEGVCGIDPALPRNRADLANDQSDLSLAHWADQPAGVVTCSMGYLAEKCGDHAVALKIFDKCIAKGYAGAMIWKGLMYETGSGLPRDDAKAAAMFKQAADSGEGHYAALGKLHYAGALHQGKGVPKDEAEARRWFQKAADEGSPDATEFLRTGYHVGGRDHTGRGVGIPTEAVEGQALVKQETRLDEPASTRALGLLGAVLLATGWGAWRRARRGAGAGTGMSAARPLQRRSFHLGGTVGRAKGAL